MPLLVLLPLPLTAQKLDYVVGMAKNTWLTALAEPLMAEVRSDFAAGKQTTRRCGECAYQAGSWRHERRVIVKAGVTAHFGRQPKDAPPFVVTNLREAKRLETLCGVLAIAFCWAYHVGAWRHRVKPIALKTHQRPAKSLFRYGFDGIRQALLNVADKGEQFGRFLACC